MEAKNMEAFCVLCGDSSTIASVESCRKPRGKGQESIAVFGLLMGFNPISSSKLRVTTTYVSANQRG